MKKSCMLLLLLMLTLLLSACILQGNEIGMGSWTEGICLLSKNGQVLLIAGSEPIALTDRSKEGDLLDGLQTGDRIRVLHDGIAESYPAQAGIYKLEKEGQGSVDDIPADVLASLRDLGWID